MKIFEYVALLRAEILEIVTGVEDSGGSLFWDETTPNYVTKRKLEKLYEKYLMEAKNFGVYVVTRHCQCRNPEHGDYPVSNEYGLTIGYKEENYIWNGGQMYQGPRLCACPCSPENKKCEHNVIDDVIYHRSADRELCEKLEEILYDLVAAIDCAEDKKARSAIREKLLRAVLRINDRLLPEPMECYIKEKMKTGS